ncbi:MAG: hypothetical protein KDK07_02570 [Bauldia sp.]|nr:hypothetical protein [Bauldia sp.]
MKRLLLLCVVAAGLSAPAPAFAWWKKGYLPECDASGVMIRVLEQFRYADRKTFHWGVDIKGFSNTYEVPEVINNTSLIGRRFCRSTAWLTDGRTEEVVYLIETKQGFSSVTYGVQSCLPAYDPWHVYGSWCRSIKP